MMRETIRHNFLESTLSYEEKPREQWLFDYPAQVSLCGTQIWWTTEVNIAFARLEEGYENALKDYQRKQVIIKKNIYKTTRIPTSCHTTRVCDHQLKRLNRLLTKSWYLVNQNIENDIEGVTLVVEGDSPPGQKPVFCRIIYIN